MSTLVYLALAAAAGRAAGRWLGGGVPYVAAGASLGGVIGAVLLALPFGDQGPALLTVALLPAAAGAALGAAAAALLIRMAARRAASAPSG